MSLSNVSHRISKLNDFKACWCPKSCCGGAERSGDTYSSISLTLSVSHHVSEYETSRELLV